MSEQDPNEAQDQPTPEDSSDTAQNAAEAALSAAQEAIRRATAEASGQSDDASEPEDAPTPEEAAMLAAAAAAIGEAQGSAQSAGPKTVGPTSSPILPDAQAEPFEVPVVQPGPGAETPEEIRLLSDVNLDVTIELGRTRMLVEDVLRLGSGAVVELDKLAGDPVDVYINGRHVARGEVLVLNDNFCVRVSEIVSADETVPET